VCSLVDIILVRCSFLALNSVKFALARARARVRVCVCVRVCACVCGDILETLYKALNKKWLKQNCRLYIDNTRENSARCSAIAELPCGTVAA
jgi:hypothetical protein